MHIWVCTFLLIIYFSPFSINECALGGLFITHQSGRQHLVLLCLLSPAVVFLLKQRRNSQIRFALLEMWSRLLYSQAPKKVDVGWARSTPPQIHGATESCFQLYRCSIVEKLRVSEERGALGQSWVLISPPLQLQELGQVI